MSKAIGIFAGTFDPIHEGHIEVARLAASECSLDEIYIAVEELPWGKKEPESIKHRTAMVDLAIASEPRIKRLQLPDTHFSISSTLPYIIERFKNLHLFFIFGADVFVHMNKQSWPDLPKLFAHHLIIFERGEVDEASITAHAASLGIQVAILPTSKLHYSSTSVRDGALDLISDPVQAYIAGHRLYM